MLISLLLSDKINLTKWTTLECDADLCLDIEDGKLLYTSKKDIYGVKIKHSNCISSVIGGDMIENKFEVSLTSNKFEVTPTSIKFVPKGSGILLEFSENLYEYCLIEIVFYEEAGWVLSHDFNPVFGCTNQTACNFNPKANNDDASCIYPPKNYDCEGNCIAEIDCLDVCGGPAIVDQCGVCEGDNTSCADCAGVPNGDSWVSDCGCVTGDNSGNDCDDCSGAPNGDAWESDCGCVAGSNSGDDCDDCAGTPNGDAYIDECDMCDSDPSNDCVQDCAGVWGGSAIIETFWTDSDGDGLGSGDSSKLCNSLDLTNWASNNEDTDDNCTSNFHDKCGICDGNDLCLDCAGIPNGLSLLDNCNTCDDDPSNDCVQDCAGVWGGNATLNDYYIDSDGDGLGSGDSLKKCDGLNLNGWASNNDDKDDNCTSNIHDECGICNGDNLSCSDCFGVPNGTAFLDDCSICSSGTTNHIPNSDQDCFNICFGKAALDCAEICNGGTRIDCFGVCDGKSKRDRCGICDGDNTSCGATYVWPTNASKTTTAFFGEERPNRYHAGLDIRTYGTIGHKLFATSDGYIKKISISTKGYGKALYLQLDDGNTALYAHISYFTKEIDDIISSLQKKYNKYSLNYIFEPYEFKVQKGDVIGYSGDTGTISGPHLHYELRDSLNRPFNPLYEYNIIDNKSPIAKELAFIPLENLSSINGLNRSEIFNLSKLTSNIYQLADTIAVNGKFGLAIHVSDKIDNQPFNYGIYKIELLIDNEKIYEVSYDVYDYNDAKYIYDERDYQLKIDTQNTFYRLFADANQNMLFVNSEYSKSYILFNDSKYHEFEIIISDFNNNKVHVSGTILNKPLPLLETIYNNKILFKNILSENNNYGFNLTGRYNEDIIFPSKKTFIENDSLYIEKTNKPFSVLEIKIKSDDGSQYLPQYIEIIKDDISVINGNIVLKHYKLGIILVFETKIFVANNAYLTHEINGEKQIIEMYRTKKNSFETKLINPSEFSNYKNIEINFDSTPKKTFKYSIKNSIAFPDDNFKLLYNGGQISITGNKHTFDDTTIVWIENFDLSNIQNNTSTIIKPIFIGPTRLEYNKPMKLTIKLPNRELLDQSSIYKYNYKNDIWDFIPVFIDSKQISLSADITSGGVYTVIQETISPTITNVYPGEDGVYYQNDFREIKFNLDDNLSGINDENNIKVQLNDERPLIFEYNSYRKQVTYKLNKKLLPGAHTLSIDVIDNVGNNAYEKNHFYIKN